MNPRIRVGRCAEEDALAIHEFLAREAGLELAQRFLASVESTTQSLLAMPHRGMPRSWMHPELSLLRSLPVRGFESYWLYYRCDADSITVDRILHGARDVERILRDRDEPDVVHETASVKGGLYPTSADTAWRVAC